MQLTGQWTVKSCFVLLRPNFIEGVAAPRGNLMSGRSEKFWFQVDEGVNHTEFVPEEHPNRQFDSCKFTGDWVARKSRTVDLFPLRRFCESL